MNRRQQCRTMLIAFSLALPATGLPLAAGQSVLLVPRYDSQHDSYLEFAQEVEQTLSGGKLGDGTVRTQIAQTFGLRQRVESTSAEASQVRLTFERVAQRIESEGLLTLAYDSDRPAADQSDALLAEVYRPMLGMPLTMEVAADGTIRSFRGMEPVLARVKESAAENMMFERIRTSLCDDMARCIWGDSLLVVFPGRAVGVGEHWTRTLEQPNPLTGPLTLEYQFKLEKVEQGDGRELAELSFRGQIRPAAVGVGPANCTVCYELESGAFEGTATIDVQRGACIRQAETGEVMLKMTVPDAANPEPARMTLVQKTKLSFRSLPMALREKDRSAPPLEFKPRP